ncbi:MAG TPA: MATE family efflux transporter [Bacillota bacterium]
MKKSSAFANASLGIKSFVGKSFFSKLFGDRTFYRIVLRLALPVTLQHFIMSGLNMLDTIMVGQLGETEIAAVGLSNQLYFILSLFLLGVGGSCSMFISQFWGKQDRPNIRRILGLSLLVNSAAAFLFFLVGFCFPEAILSLFSKDTELIRIGGDYLRITAFSYIIVAITVTYSAALRSMEEVKLPMRASVIGLTTNAVLNYLLIFGRLGLPRLGIVGAALGTVIARLVELGILLTVTYTCKYLDITKFMEMFRFSKDLVKRYFSTSTMVVVKDVIWAIGMTIYMAIYGRIGTEVVAVLNIVATIRQLATVFFNGLANACLIMVGKEIGAGDEDRAYLYSERFLILTAIFGVFMGLTIFCGKNLILLPYNISAQTTAYAMEVLSVLTFVYSIAVFNMVGVVGVLRSGGDAMFCLVMDLIAVYLIGLPLAYLSGLVWQLSIGWVFALVNLQEVYKMIMIVKRFVTRKWIHNLVSDLT